MNPLESSQVVTTKAVTLDKADIRSGRAMEREKGLSVSAFIDR